jgi:hypothetical protein
MEEFYSMVDWNDTEANLTEEFKDYVKRLSAKTNPDKNPDEVIYDESGIDPESLAVSQGQIQMSKTGGMVTSMKNHDSSFKAYMADAHPDIEYGSDEYYDMRNRWLYGNSKPDGSAFAVPLIDENGQKLNKDGDPIGEGGTQGIISQPWFTSGSIISTSDGYVVDGHHRWASFIAYNHGLDERAKLKLKSVVIDAPIQDALAIGKAYQEHWGIKAAKLGKEEMFERVDGAGSMDMDAKKAHIDELFVEDADGIPLAQQKAREIYKDLYEQKEGFGYVQKMGTRCGSDRGRELSPEEIADLDRRAPTSTRSAAVVASVSTVARGKPWTPTPKAKKPSIFGRRREKIGQNAAPTLFSTRSSSGNVSPSANAVPSTEAQKTWKKLHDLESNKKGAINDMTDSELAELGISRSSRDGIIDGKPVYVAETQESAVALMSLGYNVELGDGARARKVKRAVAQLQKEIDAYLDQRTDMSPEERASYKIDSCRMYIANTNIFCGKNIGTARMNMPQISGRMKCEETVAAMAANAGLDTVDRVDASNLEMHCGGKGKTREEITEKVVGGAALGLAGGAVGK